ncbi:MAG TPA: response regulator, partial [Polyangiaceae bacterium]|nr:response regulator [Polyangiaceae bacterium]
MSAQQAKILIVEDDVRAADELSEILRALGFEVSAKAACAEEAIAAASTNPPDLVLLDVGLEGTRDGIETAAILRHQYRLPVVFLTAYSDPHTLQRAKDAEPYAYLIKPVKVNDLRSTLTLALHRAERDRSTREQTTWLTAMLDSLSDAVVGVTGTDHITYMNRSAELLFGCVAGEMKGRPLSELELRTEATNGDATYDTVRTTMLDTQGRALGALLVHRPALRARTPTLRPTQPSPSMTLPSIPIPTMPLPSIMGLRAGASGIEPERAAARASTRDGGATDGGSHDGGATDGSSAGSPRDRASGDGAPVSSTPPDGAESWSSFSAREAQAKGNGAGPSAMPPSPFPASPQLATLVTGVAQEVNNPLAYVVVNQEYAIQELLKLEARLEADLPGGDGTEGQAPPSPRSSEPSEVRHEEAPSGSHRIADTRSMLQNVRSALSDAQMGAARVRTAVAELSQLNPLETRPPPGAPQQRPSGSYQLDPEVSLPMSGRVPSSRLKRILLVDDERPLLEAMARMLGSAHYIARVTSAEAALALLAEDSEFDLVLSDVVMPSMDGLQFYAEVERRHPELAKRFAFMTGGVLSNEVRSFLTSGRCPLLLKPFSHEELREFIGN